MKKNESPRKWKIDAGTALVIGAAIFQAYQFGRALYIYNPSGWSLAEVNIGGLFLGALVNVIIVLAATRLPVLTAAAIKTKSGKADKKTMAANARKEQKAGIQARFAQAAFVGLIALSPFLVAPALYISWSALPLPQALIICLSVGWAIAPDLGIALGGFVAGKSLVELSGAPARTGARNTTESATQSVGRAQKSVAGASQSATESVGVQRTAPRYPRRCEHCPSDSPFGVLKNANSVGGHMKKHHPELCKPKALAEQLFKVEVKE